MYKDTAKNYEKEDCSCYFSLLKKIHYRRLMKQETNKSYQIPKREKGFLKKFLLMYSFIVFIYCYIISLNLCGVIFLFIYYYYINIIVHKKSKDLQYLDFFSVSFSISSNSFIYFFIALIRANMSHAHKSLLSCLML